MPDQPIPVNQPEETASGPRLTSRFDPTMVHICIELFTRATLYAGAIGLIAGLVAVLFGGD